MKYLHLEHYFSHCIAKKLGRRGSSAPLASSVNIEKCGAPVAIPVWASFIAKGIVWMALVGSFVSAV